MFVPLRPTQQDRNSSRLHDSIIKHFNFAQAYCSKCISVREYTIKSYFQKGQFKFVSLKAAESY